MRDPGRNTRSERTTPGARRRARTIALAVVCAATFSGLVGPSAFGGLDAHAARIKLATLVPERSVWYEGLQEMGADWQSATDGRVRLQIYAGGVAGDEPDVLRKIRIGQLHAATLTVSGLAEIDDAFAVFSIPLFYESYEELFHVMEALRPMLEKRLAERGYAFVNWGYGGWVHLFTTEPASTIDEIKRVKMFASAGDNRWVEMWKRRGYNPVPLATTDILTGLQTGLIDGLPTTPLAALLLQWFRHAPNMIDLPLAPLVGATVVKRSAWERISEADRRALLRAAGRLESTLRREVPRQDREAIEAMKKRGLAIVATGDGTPAWHAEARGIASTMRDGTIPAEVLEAATRARDAYRAERAAETETETTTKDDAEEATADSGATP